MLDRKVILDILPLTPMQEGMLFHFLKEPESNLYLEQLSLTVSGNLEIKLCKKAWNAVIDANEMLRAAFRWEKLENPVLIILKEFQLQPLYYDLTDINPNNTNNQLDTIKLNDRETKFDLHEVPFRVTLCKTGKDHFEMIISYHHILFDGWSTGIILEEFFTVYNALAMGKEWLKPVKTGFKEFVKRYHTPSAGPDITGQEYFWKNYLAGIESPTELSLKKSWKTNGFIRHTGTALLTFVNDEKKDLDSFIKNHKITLASLFYCAWGILLQKYNNCDDVIFGTTTAGRPSSIPGIEKMVGLFINTIPLRIFMNLNESIPALLSRTEAALQTREKFEHSSLADIKKYSGRTRNEELFDSIIVIENYPLDNRLMLKNGKLKVDSYSLQERTHYDLTIQVKILTDVEVNVSYNRNSLDEEIVSRLCTHFKSLVLDMLKNPGKKIFEIDILREQEKKQLLYDFNNTTADYPDDKTIHQLFVEQATRTPDNIAVVGTVCPDASGGKGAFLKNRPLDPQKSFIYLTYRELNDQSDRLAGILIEKGVLADTTVGIMMGRCIEMIIGIMGILKAGGAYLPISPDLPDERIQYMLEDSNTKILLATEECQKEIIINCNLKNLPKAPFHHSSFILNGRPRRGLHHSRHLAYIIYTSGTTGKPKGVIIEHRSVVNRLHWMQKTFPISGKGVLVQKTSFMFDVSVWEIFWWSFTGASLFLLGPGEEKNPGNIIHAVERFCVTVIHFVPPMLSAFLDYVETNLLFSKLAHLKNVFASGEALTSRQVIDFNRLLKQSNGTGLINLYGPTEATVDVSYFNCPVGEVPRNMPIGKPIDNIQLYIVDRVLQLQPIGVPGELCISGVGLARGYLNRPELTAERFCFVKSFSGGAGGRFYKKAPLLYRTGDLVRWLEDGAIEFLGRLDFQVKVRGFRIELGEIESRLREHDAVHDAVVLALEAGDDGGAGNKKLTAYIVPCRNYQMQFPNKKTDQVSDWEGVFDETYAADPGHPDLSFNIVGWNSSYTGERLPAAEMREWVDQTAARIFSLAPQRVLEIGCGTGLFLFRLIRRCGYYVGTDIAKQGLDYIGRQLDRLKDSEAGQADWAASASAASPAPVELLHRSAENFEGMEDKDLDMVIMNSVIQYFPSAEYLVDVLSKAVQNLKTGGHIFIGDVRSLPLLKTFHASVELSRAGGHDTPRQVLARVMNKLTAEQELVVDPNFFIALEMHLPQIKQVELLLKYGRYNNELSKFRYDVILHIGARHDDCNDGEFRPEFTLDWEAGKPGMEGIRQWLKGLPGEPGVLMVKGVWNPRVYADFQVLEWLGRPGRAGTVGQFRRFLAEQKIRGVEPDDFLALAGEFPYHIAAVISKQGGAHTYDVILRRINHRCGGAGEKAGVEIHPWHSYTNNPLLRKMTEELVPQLRDYLKERIPEYMTPSHFILLDSLPLTANGKLDRGALPLYEPTRSTPEQENGFVEPGTETERILIDLWKNLLSLDKISIHDNFFQLGGDSINAIQMISRINKKGFNLTVSHLYRNMTVVELGRYIDNHWAEVTVSGQAPAAGQAGILSPRIKITKEDVQRRLPAGVEIEDVYPLTPLQRHMLGYYLRDKQGKNTPGLYVNQVRMRVTLDKSYIPLLIQAFRHLTEVYPYLRTAFMWENFEEPVQVVHKNAPVDIQYFDWSHLPPGERDQCIREFLARDHYRGFEPDNPVGDRIAIIALSPSESLIIKTSDLMRVDGWSAMIITGKLFEYMRGLSTGQEQKMKSDSNYREYISWLSAQDQAKGKDFWQAMIRGCSIPTPLVERAPRNHDSGGKKEEPGFLCRYRYLTRQQTTELNDFLKQNQLTLSALACGIWALLLGHYTGHESVIFGILFSGRGAALAGIESMIGQSINILPMRIDIDREAPILNWVRQAWDALTGIQPYEVNRQDQIRDWWGSPPGQPLFESYLVLENFPGVKEQSKLDDSGQPNLEYIAQMEYPLRVEFEPGPELGLLMQYYQGKFTADSIAAMLNDELTLLNEISINPDRNVSDLERFIGRQFK
ncbi:MAG: hypothetical protein QG657_249 [Acidobacteriota bacterium]|nr:hypothetical protein [Acidobacteriota bacterium]